MYVNNQVIIMKKTRPETQVRKLTFVEITHIPMVLVLKFAIIGKSDLKF